MLCPLKLACMELFPTPHMPQVQCKLIIGRLGAFANMPAASCSQHRVGWTSLRWEIPLTLKMLACRASLLCASPFRSGVGREARALNVPKLVLLRGSVGRRLSSAAAVGSEPEKLTCMLAICSTLTIDNKIYVLLYFPRRSIASGV